MNAFARIVTQNTFPKGVGAAASASGFAALTVAGFCAATRESSERELSIFARLGSGSACRSIPDGFVIWEEGERNEDSYAYSLYPHTHWDICDVLVIVDSSMKKVPTTDGMKRVKTSSLLTNRLEAIPQRLVQLKRALKEKDFTAFGEVVEEDCLDMHHVMQTQVPSLNYWNNTTITLMNMTKKLRDSGCLVYFTIDAGPNVHLIVEGKNEQRVLDELRHISCIESVIRNIPAPGGHIIDQHLF